MLPLQAALLSIKGHLPVADRAHEILFDQSISSRDHQIFNSSEKRPANSERPSALRVEFDAVSFEYSGATESAIRNFSLTIEAGQQVAFIGPSGAGKSTLADLMCGVLTPTSGYISVNTGNDESGTNPTISVSYVPQKPGLVAGNVVHNVALGVDQDEVDEHRVREALENAHMTSVVDSLPEGVHTDLGNYQDGLSGGQIQRLGLARALYSQPGLLVMDEATSALDAESEAEIAKALNQMRGKVTVVIIAHRLNTVQHADKVIYIEQGKLADEGTFQELIRRNPSIDRLVQLMKVDEV
jgi:ATP-binding cassette subfamily C protein